MKIAHISDLHFAHISFCLSQFFSKRWLGNLNFILNRQSDFPKGRPFTLIDVFIKWGITDVIISGDLTITGSKKEYLLAASFVKALEKEGLNVYLIPGNHDHYLKKSYQRKIFYDYFPPFFHPDSHSLKEQGVSMLKLQNEWWLVGIDTTLATSLTSSSGYFTPEIETHLQKALDLIPKEDKILLVNHFPFFQNEKPHRRLKRGPQLQNLIEKNPNIQIYLHGHTHRRCVADLRENNLPIVIGSGSTGHRLGSWNLLDLTQSSCDLQVVEWKENQWHKIEHKQFEWEK